MRIVAPALSTIVLLAAQALPDAGHQARADQSPAVRLCAASNCERPKTLFSWGGEQAENEPEEEDKIETDRPDFTEASTTVGLGHVQLETGYTFTYDDDGTRTLYEHSSPEALLRIGMLAEWFEMRIGWNYLIDRVHTAGGRDTVDGAEDLYLGIKLALTEQEGWLPEMVLLPQMTVPTGARAFTQNEVMPGLSWLYGWDFCEEYSLGGSTQANRAQEGSGNFYTELAQSITASKDLTEKLSGYFEWFAFFPHGAADADTRPEHYLNTGLAWGVTNDLQFDARVGWGLNDAADDLFTGVGMSVRF